MFVWINIDRKYTDLSVLADSDGGAVPKKGNNIEQYWSQNMPNIGLWIYKSQLRSGPKSHLISTSDSLFKWLPGNHYFVYDTGLHQLVVKGCISELVIWLNLLTALVEPNNCLKLQADNIVPRSSIFSMWNEIRYLNSTSKIWLSKFSFGCFWENLNSQINIS